MFCSSESSSFCCENSEVGRGEGCVTSDSDGVTCSDLFGAFAPDSVGYQTCLTDLPNCGPSNFEIDGADSVWYFELDQIPKNKLCKWTFSIMDDLNQTLPLRSIFHIELLDINDGSIFVL